MAMKRTVHETLEHKEAFEYYYSLGETRGLQAVSKFIGKGFATVKRWSVSFGWTARIRDRDKELGRQLEERTNHTVLTSKVEYRSHIRTLIEQFQKDVADGRIRIRSIKDFDMVVRLDMELMGVGLDEGEDDNMKSLAEVLRASADLIRGASGNDMGNEDAE